jgi:hypothetical protein
MRYAAWVRGFWLKRRATSRRLAPRRNSERKSKSVLTVGSAPSIFAMRDWLDPKRCATSVCVRPKYSRQCRSPAAKAILVSINRRSSSDRWRKSPASPTVQPARSYRRRLSLRMARVLSHSRQPLEFFQAPLACSDHGARRRVRLLLEHVENHYRVSRDVVHDPPNRWIRRAATGATGIRLQSGHPSRTAAF